MKTNDQIEKDILAITMKINNEFPELSKFVNEMPVKFLGLDRPGIEAKSLAAYHDSLVDMINEYAKTHTASDNFKEKLKFPGNRYYPASEDIYNQAKELTDRNPEDLRKRKAPNDEEGTMNEKDFKDDMTGGDLDIPGSELDDQEERIGSEDEENNYYSLGGDGHKNLEEDNG